MLRLFVMIYRRLTRLQASWLFRVIASVLVVAGCTATFGSLIYTSYSLDNQREALLEALEGQNLNDRDEHALTLRETGTMTLNGRTYTTTEFARDTRQIFDESGNIAVPHFLVGDLLAGQIPEWAPSWLLAQPGTTWMLAIIVTGWLLLIVWMEIALAFVLTLLGTLLPVGLFWLLEWEQAMLAVAGIGLLTFTFILLTRTALLLLNRPNQIMAVAHTVVKEASRSRISLVFIVLLLIVLPLLPIWLNQDDPLRFRVQTFISRSVGLTYALAVCMTLFLACATVAFEMRDRQIWQLMTKPVNRFSYLIGKWLGVLTVNMILLIVAGVSTFTFIQYLRTLPVAPGIEGQLDRVQLNSDVLTARIAIKPQYESLTAEQLRLRVDQFIESDPDLSQRDLTLTERREIRDNMIQSHSASQRQIPPGRMRNYTFSGLEEVRRSGATLTLRYRFHILRSDVAETFEAMFMFNEQRETTRQVTYVPTMSHVMLIGSDVIADDGTLTVGVGNLYQPPPGNESIGAIHFEEKDFELLYEVASFESNFLRAVLVVWLKLAFLAMLGIACSTFLNFSVACLLSFTIFMGGSLAPFLQLALLEYEYIPTGRVDWTNLGMVVEWGFRGSVRAIAQLLVLTLRPFGEFRPTNALVEGRLIPWGDVGTAAAVLGIFWSGVSAVIGYVVLRNRQMAIYSGHG